MTDSDVRISIVIPVFREYASISRCLRHLASQKAIGTAEVIVVDGDEGSTLAQIQDDYPFPLIRIIAPRGRGIQLNRGVAESRGPALLFLHADTLLPRGALVLVRKALEVRQAGSFDLQVDTSHYGIKLIRLFASVRSRITRIPYGDQAIFIRRCAFDAIGGFEPIPIMEDVALMQKLKSERTPIIILKRAVRTSERRWRSEGIIRSTLRNWYIYLRYLRGASPSDLVSLYPPHDPGKQE